MGSLYRKYRPRALSEVVGQRQVITLLEASLAAGQVAHAYLLAGPHGVGKTSIARILAHQINQLDYADDSIYLDIIEIDAASNNGVDDIRELRERVQIAPAHAAYKVYIIDEVHMLSRSAFNALLKTLEEPPAHVVFILATTEPDKLPETILSRVQRYNFEHITTADIVAHLTVIARKEKIAITPDALTTLAEYGRGSFRDSISALDQIRYLSTDHEIIVDDVRTTLGIASHEQITDLLNAVRTQDLATIVTATKALEAHGAAIRSVVDQLTIQIQATLAKHPAEITLLDALLEVPSSSYPYLKLLTAVARNLTPQPATKPTTVIAPKPTNIAQTVTTPELHVAPATTKSTTPTPPAPKAKTPKAPIATKPFAWAAFLTAVSTESGALHALLAKAGYDYVDDRLTIYAGTAFAAKKLDAAKYRQVITAVALGFNLAADQIVVSPGKKPPSDATSAAVAAIMGGGEEVEVHAN